MKKPHSAYSRERELYDGQFLKFLFRILKLSYIFCLGYFWQSKFSSYVFNRRCFWRCCRGCWNSSLLLGQPASACTFDPLSVLLPSLCLDVCLLCTLLSKHYPAVHSVVIVCAAGDTRLWFKLLLKFRNVLKHTESRSSLACNHDIEEEISTGFELFLCFEVKRQTDPSRKHPRNARVISAKNWVQCLKIT